MADPKRISILGATGSIGCSALEAVRQHPGKFQVTALAAHANADRLAAQIQEFRPQYAALTDPNAAATLDPEALGVTLFTGPGALEEIAAVEVDVALCAVVGAVGLKPLLRAIDAGNTVAVANKEPFVMAGRLVMERAKAAGVQVLPVDSEHSAIFQCIEGHKRQDVACIHLTASGGPFYGRDKTSLSNITPEEATNHPTWDMGAKISVDSATLMNKGLEIVEAMWLFGLPESNIEVVIHPQSVIHSFVEFKDGNILAHLGVTDMKFPIVYALAYPDRVDTAMERLQLQQLGTLSFAAPAFEEFPCLGYARAAACEGGTAPAILNAANEEAVAAFCRHDIPFLGISEIVRDTREHCPVRQDYSLESIQAADRQAREAARRFIQKAG